MNQEENLTKCTKCNNPTEPEPFRSVWNGPKTAEVCQTCRKVQ